MKISKQYIFLGIFLGTLPVSYWYFSAKQTFFKEVASFEACVKAGFPILSVYPEVCAMPGKQFVNNNQKEQESHGSAEITLLESSQKIQDAYKNLQYYIDGQNIQFLDGLGVLPSNMLLRRATSALQLSSTYVELNSSEKPSLALIVLLRSVEFDSKKTAQYITGVMSLNSGYSGLNALYLDTSVSSSTISYKDHTIIIDYTTDTGTKKKRHYIFENDILKEITNS